MAAYSRLYAEEEGKRRAAEAKLRRSDELVCTFREFVRSKGLMGEMLEFLLVKHLGEEKAAEILTSGDDSSSTTPGSMP